ncbi:MAG: OmpA family protein [Phycisphaerae bacterium]|nr:OmpA family protein [Phycisphaerae bacterium]
MNARPSVLAMLLALVALVGGCCQKEKAQIEQLMGENEALADQLRACNENLDAKEADLAQARDALASARNQSNQLQAALDKARSQPPLPAGWEERGGVTMTSLSTQVLFDSGKAKLKGGATGRLDKVISEIRRSFPGRDVYIIGCTDSDPIRKSGWKDNLDLSLARSAEVTRYMTRHGLSAKQVVTGGVGEHRPTGKGKSADRRVEFWILRTPR